MMNLLSLKQYTNQLGYENNLRGSASSRRLFTHLSPSGLACRLVLTLAVIFAGANASWGQGYYDVPLLSVTSGNGDNSVISSESFNSYDDSYTVELRYLSSNGGDINGWGIGKLGSKGNADSGEDINAPSISLPKGTTFVVTYNVGKFKSVAGTSGGVQFRVWNADLKEVVILVPDAFVNSAKIGKVSGIGFAEKNKATDAYGDFTLSAASSVTEFTNITNVKYARIYVTDASGKKLDYDTQVDGSHPLLEVTGGQVAGSSKKNGLYVYNGGSNLDLSGITVKLNAGVGNLKKYKVVALLSTDASASATGNTVNVEPQWDYEYTYKFTYPETVEERVIQLDSELNTGSEIGTNYVALKYRTEAITYLTDEGGVDKDNWYGRWYIRDKSTKIRETLGRGLTQDANQWMASIRLNGETWENEEWNGVTFSDNCAYNCSKNNNGDWVFQQMFGFFKVFWPSSISGFEDCSDYEIVFEASNEYEGDDPVIKLRYVFQFPVSDNFLGKPKASVTSGNGSQEVEKTATSGAFTLNGVYSNDIKYARIILCDEDGKALADQSKLVVTYNGAAAVAAGSKTKNGVYIYNNGNTLDKSKISVTLNAGLGNMSKYRIKCLLAEDAATDISTKEPDWDYEYTYKFSYPTRGTFTALNINDVKTKYKTELYDATSRSATIHLLSNWYEVAGDCDASKQELADNGYVRWYLTDAEGNLLTIKNLTSSDAYTSLSNDYGYWRKGFNKANFRESDPTTRDGDYAGYNPTITIPDGVDYKNVRIVCVATTLLDEMDMSIPQEPESLQVKYVYSLMTQDDLTSAPFVHYIGESHLPYKTVSGTPGATQRSWSHETGLVDATTYASQNIRQDVHQTDYYVYINKTSPNPDKLMLTLPIMNWASSDGIRSSTEPLAYFRWYDWNTDMGTTYLNVANTEKTKLVQRGDERGLMALMLSGSSEEAYRNEIGVKLNAAGIAALNANQEILIACDISRYMDGITLTTTDNKSYTPYLVHEPTLSMRYLFHILPSTVIADNIDAGASTLKSVEAKLAEGKNYWNNDEISKVERVQMFQTYEDNGRVVVSLNGTTGKFAMRAALQELNQYFINSGGSTVQCSNIQWYSYYEDEDGLWKKTVTMNKTGENPEARNTVRLAKYETSDFIGTYTKVGGSATKEVSVVNGTQLHLIGCLGNGTVEQAVVHYGLEFIDEKPEKLGSESSHRTDDFMYQNLTHGKTLDFNDFFVNEATRFDKPLTSYDNYAKIPLVWESAQYGFCYPQLYGQCASNWQIHHGGWWEGYGFAPTHSDYTLLKTMNVPSVSASQTFENQAIYTFWYNDKVAGARPPLYDVTHERLYGKNEGAKNGTFLYIDASDEARTFAQLQFTASLCAGSEIYYSAYLANMTGIAEQDPPRNHVPAQTPPQVMFRVSTDVTEGGVTKRVPVVSFLTGDLYTVGATEGTQWYQVYGFTKIPKELENYVDGQERTYYVSIDNYSENTDGADYAVDQISFFTSSATVQVTQSSTPCDESSGVEVTIMAPADELINVVGRNETKTLYYRLFEKSSDPNHVLSAQDAVSGPYKNDIETYANVYGSVEFRASYNRTELETYNVYDQPKEGTTGFYISSENGKVYYQFDKREFNLKMGKKYFVSFLEIGKTAAGAQDLTDWGSPYGGKICSTVFSNDIEPRLLRIDLESGGVPSDGSIELGCGVTSVPKSFLITVEYPTIDGYNQHTDVMFDFYHDTKAKFKAVKNTNGLYLERALEHMRLTYPGAYTSSSELPTEYITTEGKEYNAEMRALIAEYMNNGMLDLSSTRTFNYTFTTADAGEKKFAAIPVSRLTSDGYICSPLEFVFDVDANSNGPKMDLGFADVTYPADYMRVVRVGLEQLNKMKTEQYKLHIPVNSFENKGAGKDRKLHFSNPYLYLVSTDDPTIDMTNASSEPIVVAKIFDPAGGSNKTDVYVSTTRMYLPLDFSGDNCKVNFHEGYKYEVSTSFYDEEEESLSESSRCIGDLYLVFKVVPKYVTWNAQQLNATQWSGNWYNDDNWNRSVRSELYKDTGQNTDGYENNGEGSLSGLSATSNPGFMPMKFTYVTMLSNNHSPSLVSESTNSAPKIVGTPQTGGDLINPSNELGSDTSPSGGSSYPKEEDRATIRFDMLVRYGTHAKGGEGCFGHQTMSNSGGSWGWNTFDPTTFTENAKAYDCEKFYGNVCKEIYFKPGAELRLQQRLTYEKAWVEEELKPNMWYLMSTPLKGTYAGDMYVPATAKTDYSQAGTPSVTGRQVTEAFQPITFNQSKGYSRTQYPVYQRSWGLPGSKVYTKAGDVRATDYSAYIKYPGVSANQIEWSHTYNDVQVPYSSFSGFAIRANRKSMTDNALIRLPKADESYDYYQWDNMVPASGAVGAKTVTKGEELYGRFVFDNTSADQEQWTIPLSKLQAQGTDEDGYTYYLVGNPFMASIDMGVFFYNANRGEEYNPLLDPVYYTYEDGVLQATDARTTAKVIRPLQAFVVRCRAAEKPEKVVFHRRAITDGNYTPATLYVPANNTGGARRLTLKASGSGGSSTASVAVDSQASDGYDHTEDAMTLFDSNLSDVPVVFTITDGRAVSIDSRQSLGVVPFGVACAGSNELVSVECSFSHQTSDISQLYVVDAVTGGVTEVVEGGSVMVQPNDYGRYFLTTRSDLTAVKDAKADGGIVVSVRGSLVTVKAGEALTSVRALTTGGATVYSEADCGPEMSFRLNQDGVYIIEAQTAEARKTVKIVVKN